jgi:S1-C subfamily serine protease
VGSAGVLALGGLGMIGSLVYGLRSDLQKTHEEMVSLRELTQRQADELNQLEGRLGDVGRELIDVKQLEADARARLLEEIESRTGTKTEEQKREFEQLEQRLQALRSAAEEHGRLLAAAKVSEDLDLRYRELMSPTVRINARHEVGSGTIVWSKKAGKRARTYVLTAWHIVQDNLEADGPALPLEIDFYGGGELIRSEPGNIVAQQVSLDLALVEVRGYHVYEQQARLPSLAELDSMRIFSKVYAIGCPLGYSPMPTSGELASKEKELDGNHYWMVNAPTIFGNSGGGIYHARTRALIGVLSRISAYKNMIDVAVPHMGLVTSMDIVYDWLKKTRYSFIVRDRVTEPAALPASTPKKKE